jgi:hypothetical protein
MFPLFMAYRKLFKLATAGASVVKAILFLILLILSIVSLAGAANSKSTGKGKGVLALTVFIFLITLCLPAMEMIGIDTNQKVMMVLVVYLALALTTTIMAYENSKLVSGKEKKQSDNAARSATGIVVLTSLYLIGGAYLFYMADAGVKNWARQGYFVSA